MSSFIPIKLNPVTGNLAQFALADAADLTSITRRGASGNLTIGGNIGASDKLQLGSAAGTVEILGAFLVDGSSTVSVNETVTGNFTVDGTVNLGNNAGHTINLGGGTADTIAQNATVAPGAGLVSIGSSVSQYELALWLKSVGGASSGNPGLAAYNLQASGTNAGAYAIGVDRTRISQAQTTSTDLMDALADMSASISSAGTPTLQNVYGNGQSIAVTSGHGSIAFSNNTNSDTTPVLTLSKAPTSASTGGDAFDITVGVNSTGNVLVINNAGSGNALDAQKAGVSVFKVTGAGGITGAGASGAPVALGATAASATLSTTTSGNVVLSSAAEISLTDSGLTLTLSQSSARALVDTGTNKVFSGVTSLLGGLNALATKADTQGNIQSFVVSSGYTTAVGDVVALNSSSQLVKSTAAGAANVDNLGCALDVVVGNGTLTCRVAMLGAKVTVAGQTWTPGGALFAPVGTGGPPTQAASSTTGDLVQRVGWAATATTFYWDPAVGVVL